MKRINLLIALVVLGTTAMMAQQTDPAQQKDPIAVGLGGVATVVGETKTADSPQEATVAAPAEVRPAWKDKLYYGYNFDIYWHHNSRVGNKENGWSFTLEPEIGWRMSEKFNMGLRLGGTYQNTYSTYTSTASDGSSVSQDLRVRQGSWSATPYVRYRLKTLFNDKVGVWIEAHLHAGMEFPKVAEGIAAGTDYDGLRHTVVYGAQVSPVITYQFNKKSNLQIFFSILSLGYSGTAYCYTDPTKGNYNEYTNDVIIFSGKLKNLLANQFTPGLYGLKFGVQKSF